MKQLIILGFFIFTTCAVEAQTSDQVKILGTWLADSIAGSEIGEEELAFFDDNKAAFYFTFAADSLVTMPDTEGEYTDNAPQFGRYYLKNNQIFILLNADMPGKFEGATYSFINDDYLLIFLSEEDDGGIYFKKQ